MPVLVVNLVILMARAMSSQELNKHGGKVADKLWAPSDD
jgi:hypothetical protein